MRIEILMGGWPFAMIILSYYYPKFKCVKTKWKARRVLRPCEPFWVISG